MAFLIPATNSLRAGSGSGSLLRSLHYYRHCFVRRTTRAQAEGEDTGVTKAPDQQTSDTVSSPSTKSKGLGFGSSVDSSSVSTRKDKEKSIKKKRSRDKASVVRRTPIEKPPLLPPDKDTESEQQSTNEGAFLLTWLGLGILIFIEGIVLAVSGLLPEEWDKFVVKYLYPSFTPTVFLFVAGTVGYGVYKYLQGENQKRM